MGKTSKLHTRIVMVNDVRNGQVSGIIYCIGKNGMSILTTKFDSFRGHLKQTAEPIGMEYHEVERNILRCSWNPQSSEIQLLEDNGVRVEDQPVNTRTETQRYDQDTQLLSDLTTPPNRVNSQPISNDNSYGFPEFLDPVDDQFRFNNSNIDIQIADDFRLIY